MSSWQSPPEDRHVCLLNDAGTHVLVSRLQVDPKPFSGPMFNCQRATKLKAFARIVQNWCRYGVNGLTVVLEIEIEREERSISFSMFVVFALSNK